MPTSLTLDTAQRANDNLYLIATGEIDLSNIDAFQLGLEGAIAKAASSGVRLTVDLTAVEYVDSATINALSVCADSIASLIIDPMLMTTLIISGLTELIHVEPGSPTAGN